MSSLNFSSSKIQNTKCAVSINKELYELIHKIPVKENGYIFGFGGFKQTKQLAELLTELNIKKRLFMV